MLIVFVTGTSIEHHRVCADDMRMFMDVLIVWLTTTRKRGRVEGIFRAPYCSASTT